ncbi:MAG: restriction endonuclease subunit S, partial [Clostridiales bacterium]|nr:restriction endonuclease subunit S [Clostridiales bacterium]
MRKVKLTSICKPKQWKTIPASELKEVGYPVYGANGIIGYYDKYNHEAETVAITCRGATCGTVNLTKPKAYITGNAMCLDEVSADVKVKYLTGYPFYSASGEASIAAA